MDADEDQMGAAAAYFPAPPPFWKSFTTENLSRLEGLKKDSSSASGEAAPSTPQLSASQLLNLPTELRFLVPPEPPAEADEYRVFNELTKAHGHDIFNGSLTRLATALDVQGILPGWQYERLYHLSSGDGESGPQSEWSQDRQHYLLRFVRSILMNFLELLSVLVADPTSEDKNEKLKDILNLVANVHALINEYRPHQARETLIHLMQDQLDRKRAEIEGIRQMKDKVATTLAELVKNAPDSTGDVAPETAAIASVDEKRKDTQRKMWHALDKVVGH